MKYLLFLSLLFIITSCSTTFLIIDDGENFNGLNKITDGDKNCLYPRGGDNERNMVFTGKESNGYYNIYMKDNIFSKAMIQKTAGNNLNFFPDYCDSTKNIAFQYYDTNNFDIYYLNATSGKALIQVTDSKDNEYFPSWSRDGNLIAYEKGVPPKFFTALSRLNDFRKIRGVRSIKNQIWLKHIKTGEVRLLGDGSNPAISPDGNKIAFVKYENKNGLFKERGTIWVMNIDGNFPMQLTASDLGNATEPCWSPDGNRIAFTLAKKDKPDTDIYSINVNGEFLRQHTSNESDDFSPYWSTDNYLYFTSDRGSRLRDYQIWRFKIF